MATIEEIKEFFKEETNKQAFSEIANDLGFKSEDEIKGLENKKNELLGKLTKQKKEMTELQKIIDEVDVDEYNEYRNKKDSSGGDLEKLQRQLAKLQKDFEDKTGRAELLERQLNDTLKQGSISKALDKYNIDPVHKELILSAYLGKAEVEEDDSNRSVLINTGDGLRLPVEEYFKTWADSENGKIYLRQPQNNGAKSNSMGNSTAEKTITRINFDKLSPVEKSKAIEEGASIID